MTVQILEVWRGAVQAWECDHMGHFNTRFYVDRVEQALAGLFAEIGIDGSTVTVETEHHRFHREVRAGGAIYATAQFVQMGARDAEIVIRILHSANDVLSASFVLQVTCDTDWPDAAREAAAKITGPQDSSTLPRGLEAGEGADPGANRERAQQLGMQLTARSVLFPDRCDERGRLRLSAAMGAVAGAIANMRGGNWRDVLKETAPTKPQRLGGALVEFVFHHRKWPHVGDRIELWSGQVDCTDKVTKVAHWLIDPATGEAWATVRAVGVALDLDARRLVPLTPEAQDAFRREAVAGF